MPLLSDTLASYVPDSALRLLLSSHGTLPLRTSPAAVLFADTSGFTAFTERLAAKGPAGAEELTAILNNHFGQLITLLREHGGDVVKFAGDALLAIWPCEQDSDLPNSVLLASRCGLEIQRLLARGTAVGLYLSMRIAIGAGPLTCALLGGEGRRQELVLAGDALAQLTPFAAQVRPGDVALSLAAHALVSTQVDARELPAITDEAGGDASAAQPSGNPGSAGAGAVLEPVPSIAPRSAAGNVFANLRSQGFRIRRPGPESVASSTVVESVPHESESASNPPPASTKELVTSPPSSHPGGHHSPAFSLYLRLNKVLADAATVPWLDPLPTEAVAEVLPVFIPEAISSRLNAGQRGWLAELRRVTVVFAKLPNLQRLVLQDPKKAKEVVRTCQEIVEKLEGTVNKLSIDDKGVCLVVGFGLPPLAHEDDAARGARCALELLESLHALGIPASIGVTTGRVYCGSVGNDQRKEYTLMGDAVNVAARLMQQTVDGIYCDEATAQAARAKVECEFVADLTLRGKGRAIGAWRPVRVLTAPVLSDRALIGRVKELAKLEGTLDRLVRTGEGGVVLLEGEPGMGKSTLVAALAKRAELFNLFPLNGAGSPIDRSAAYHPWRAIVSQLLGLDALPPGAARLQHVEHILAGQPEMLRLIPLLSEILPLNLPDNEDTRDMAGSARADNIRELLVRLIEIAASRLPTWILLEDVHWIDSASWALAAHVAQRVSHVVLVLTTRPLGEPLPPDCQRLLSLPITQRIWLEPLGEEDIVRLVCQRLNVRSLPPEVATLIRTRADGQPLFSEELALTLRDEGLIEVEERECRLVGDPAQLARMAWPDTVQGIITARIDRLPPDEQLTCKVASVIGRSFTLELLAATHPIEADAERMEALLTGLVTRGLVLKESRQRCLFRHAITQEVAYNLMSFAQRRTLHQRAAEWYEKDLTEGRDLQLATLAHHWQLAGNLERTFYYLEKAGELAYRSGADQEAAGFFSTALELVETGRSMPKDAQAQLAALVPVLRRSHWRRVLADATLGLGEVGKVIFHAAEVVRELDVPLPSSKAAWIWTLMLESWIQFWHVITPDSWRQASLEGYGRCIEAALASERLSEAYYFQSDVLRMLTTTLKAVNLAEASGPQNVAYRAYAIMGMLVGMFRLHPLALYYFRQGRTVADRLEDRRGRSIVLYYEAVYLSGYARWAEVTRSGREGLEQARSLGVSYEIDICLTILALAEYFQGRFSRALDYSSELLSQAKACSNVQHQAWGHYLAAESLIAVGRFDEALGALRHAAELLARHDDQLSRIIVSGVTSLAYLRLGRMEEAEAEATRALERIRLSIPYNWASLEGYAAPVEVFIALQEKAHKEGSSKEEAYGKLAKEAFAAFRSFAQLYPIGRPRMLLYSARMAWLERRRGAARRAWERSLAWARRLEMPYEEALTHFDLGTYTLPIQQAGALERAHAIFLHLGCAYHVTRIEALWRTGAQERAA